MLKITLCHKGKKEVLLVPETKTINEILKEKDLVALPFDSVVLDGIAIPFKDLDKNVIELGFSDRDALNLSLNENPPWVNGSDDPFAFPAEQFSRVLVVGCACVIFSAFTPDELRDLQRFLPDALTARDAQGAVFAISLDPSSPGSLTKDGAVFSAHPSSRGKATITILIDPEVDDPYQKVCESLGPALLRLMDLEKSLKARLPEMEEIQVRLNDAITLG